MKYSTLQNIVRRANSSGVRTTIKGLMAARSDAVKSGRLVASAVALALRMAPTFGRVFPSLRTDSINSNRPCAATRRSAGFAKTCSSTGSSSFECDTVLRLVRCTTGCDDRDESDAANRPQYANTRTSKATTDVSASSKCPERSRALPAVICRESRSDADVYVRLMVLDELNAV